MRLRQIILLFSALMLCIASSCSEKDYKAEPPMSIEVAPIATLNNGDGTYFALTESAISLKKENGQAIKSLTIDIPQPETVDAGYGITKELNFMLIGLQRFDNALLTLACSQDDTGNRFHCYAIKTSLGLTSSSQYKIVSADFYDIYSNYFIAGRKDGEYYIYDYNFALVKEGNIDGRIYGFTAIGYIDSKFHAIGYLNRGTQVESGYFIINLSDINYTRLNVLSAADVAVSAFPDETNAPRLDKQSYAFVNGYVEITYSFTLYNGTKTDVIHKYDLGGQYISFSVE